MDSESGRATAPPTSMEYMMHGVGFVPMAEEQFPIRRHAELSGVSWPPWVMKQHALVAPGESVCGLRAADLVQLLGDILCFHC